MIDALLKHKAVVRVTLECQYGLIHELDSRFVLSEEELIDLKTIGKNHGMYKENDELLRIMIQQTDVSKQEEFLSALRETNQRHIANYLVNDGCKFIIILYQKIMRIMCKLCFLRLQASEVRTLHLIAKLKKLGE